MNDFKKLAQRISAISGIMLIVVGIGCGTTIAAMESKISSTEDDYRLACEKLAWYQSQPQPHQDEGIVEFQQPELQPDALPMQYVGEFMCTANCCEPGCKMCGGTGITASGTPQTARVTAGANFDVLPAGTWIYIEDVGIRQVQDTGPNCPKDHIDVAVPTHAEALEWPGYGQHKVWILQEEDKA